MDIWRLPVPLFDGFTCLTAVSGECCDNMSLEKVELKPDIYTLPAEKDKNIDGAANWFNKAAAAE